EGTFGISPSFLGLSQSSGQVTHVLLTRSRLCPGPKPGSSLHLHVLGTPPAFVLSQDQTLREELLSGRLTPPTFHKESSENYNPLTQVTVSLTPRAKLRACPWRDQTHAPLGHRLRRTMVGSPMYTKGSEAQDEVNLGTVDSKRPNEGSPVRRRRTWTHISTEVGRRVCMLLSFQRPSHLFGRVLLRRGRARIQRIPRRTGEYSAAYRGL